MRLYIFPHGPFPKRVLLYLAFKGIRDIPIVNVDIFSDQLKKPEFLALSPSGSVPTLVTDEGVGIYQSSAVIDYLEEIYPTPYLSGRTEDERRRVTSQCQLINEIFYHSKVARAVTTPYYGVYQQVRLPEAAFVASHLEWSVFEQIHLNMGDSDYLAGDRLTVADILLYPVLEYARAVYDQFIPPHLRRLVRWFERIDRQSPLPAYQVPEGYHHTMSGGRV